MVVRMVTRAAALTSFPRRATGMSDCGAPSPRLSLRLEKSLNVVTAIGHVIVKLLAGPVDSRSPLRLQPSKYIASINELSNTILFYD